MIDGFDLRFVFSLNDIVPDPAGPAELPDRFDRTAKQFPIVESDFQNGNDRLRRIGKIVKYKENYTEC